MSALLYFLSQFGILDDLQRFTVAAFILGLLFLILRRS